MEAHIFRFRPRSFISNLTWTLLWRIGHPRETLCVQRRVDKQLNGKQEKIRATRRPFIGKNGPTTSPLNEFVGPWIEDRIGEWYGENPLGTQICPKTHVWPFSGPQTSLCKFIPTQCNTVSSRWFNAESVDCQKSSKFLPSWLTKCLQSPLRDPLRYLFVTRLLFVEQILSKELNFLQIFAGTFTTFPAKILLLQNKTFYCSICGKPCVQRAIIISFLM